MVKTAVLGPKKLIETITHDDAKRKNIPTAEFELLMRKGEKRLTHSIGPDLLDHFQLALLQQYSSLGNI